MAVRGAALWSTIGQWLSFALGFATSVLLARYLLPPSAFGLFSVAMAAAGIVSTLQDFGLNRFLVRVDTPSEQVLATCTTITACVGGGIALVIAAAAGPVAWYYGQARLLPIMLLIGAAFLLLPFNTVPIALLQRELRFRSLALIALAAATANAAVSAGCALLGFGPVALACGFLAQQVARATMAQRMSPQATRLRWSLIGARPVVSFGSSTTALAISGAIGTRSPDLIIGGVLGMHAVGLFGRAAGMVDGLRVLLNGGLGSVFYSHFAQLIRARQRLDQAYLHLVACYTSVMWPAMLLLSLLAEPIVRLVYGPGWAEAATALRWVALSEIVFFALPLQSDIPLLTGHLRPLLVRNLVDTAASLLSLACLVRYGLAAAAVARLVYAAIWVCLYLGLMRRIVGFRGRDLAAAHAGSALAALAAAVPVVLILVPAGGLPIDKVMLAGISGAALWAATLGLLRHPAWRELTRAVGGARQMALRTART